MYVIIITTVFKYFNVINCVSKYFFYLVWSQVSFTHLYYVPRLLCYLPVCPCSLCTHMHTHSSLYCIQVIFISSNKKGVVKRV